VKHLGFLTILFCVITYSSFSLANLSGSLSEKAIEERLKPVGEIKVDESAGPIPIKSVASGDIGKQRYEEVCHICHSTGVGGAPKFGDKGYWAPRIAEGMDVIMKRVIEGYKAMPPKGTCMNCSDEELKKAVEYMISHAK